MKSYEHLRVERDSRDVVTVTFDLAGRPVNVFNEHLLVELRDVLDELEQDRAARVIVFRSGKKSGFIVGADVHRIQKITGAGEADRALKAGQDLFQRVVDFRIPTVAVIEGSCLGGGLEFALACRHRIAREDGSTKLGLPETQLGLLPGWGGTQRLPRQVGLQRAATMILTGSALSASKAKKAGLVEAVAGPDEFEEGVKAFVNRVITGHLPERPAPGFVERLRDGTAIGRAIVFKMARRQIARQAKHYPALPAALNAIETGLKRGIEAGLAKERQEFCEVLFTPTCRNLMELFFQRERARSRETWIAAGENVGDVAVIKTIAVLGAGTMGAGIAQLAATQGYEVVLKDIDEAAIERGMKTIESLTDKGVRKGALTAAAGKAAIDAITPTTQWDPVTRADLVIEAIIERMDVKQQVFRELDGALPDGRLIVSNTSALSISELASATDRASMVAGLHFFNPVHKMPLVEIVRAKSTSDRAIAALVDVVRKLGKTPIVVADGPGFLVNRILFPYFDEAVRLVIEGHPVADIDRDARRFGMPMGPLELLDTVGIDVAADVSRNLPAFGADESPTPKFLAAMVATGRGGRKSGSGFYGYKKGRRRDALPGEGTAATPSSLPATAEFAGEMVSGIQQRLILSLINASAECLQTGVVTSPWMADLGMVLGTGFAPFRGGPIRLAETWGFDRVSNVLQELSRLCGPRFQPSEYFKESMAEIRSEKPVRV